ncbi:MAG: leucyl aminopeptidase family protein [Beijerinckiaceae bacterium]
MPTLLPRAASTTPLWLVTETNWEAVKAGLPANAQAYVAATRFKPKAGNLALLPPEKGTQIGGVVFGMGEASAAPDPFLIGRLPKELPEGKYHIANAPDASAADLPTLALAWALGSYQFNRYKAATRKPAELVVADKATRERASLIASAVTLGRDLINTPANDMTPSALANAALDMAKTFDAKATVTVGDALLKKNFPLIHTVGRASIEAPRLVDIVWGNPKHPKLTLVGKGVCFDTGGLDIKPSAGMFLMKKDMGGAAAAITAAQMIMAAKLKVRLRLLLPIVENAISGSAFRASDIIKSRKGLTVEIGNTDAEGRLILADALALACEEKPDLLIDYATLTGAARVALGPDLPPFYTTDEALAADISAVGGVVNDPVWQLPLWPAYDRYLDSKIADLSSTGSGGMAGSVTAALFLKRFVEPGIRHAHFDIYGWVPAAKPGRPEGGEPQAARLTFALAEKLWG